MGGEKFSDLEENITTIMELDALVTDGVGFFHSVIKSNDLENTLTMMYEYIINLVDEFRNAKRVKIKLEKVPFELASVDEKEKKFAIELVDDLLNCDLELTPKIVDTKLMQKATIKYNYKQGEFDGGKAIWTMILLLLTTKINSNLAK